MLYTRQNLSVLPEYTHSSPSSLSLLLLSPPTHSTHIYTHPRSAVMALGSEEAPSHVAVTVSMVRSDGVNKIN